VRGDLDTLPIPRRTAGFASLSDVCGDRHPLVGSELTKTLAAAHPDRERALHQSVPRSDLVGFLASVARCKASFNISISIA
jgi:hypothetical protein